MRPVFATLLLTLAVVPAACGGDSGPAGTYVLDTSEVTKRMEAEMAKVPEAQKKMMEAMLGNMIKSVKDWKMEFKLNGDKSFSGTADMMGKKGTIEGTWKLEGDQITMTSTKVDGEAKVETKTGTFKDGQIVITEGEGQQKMEMVLNRQ